MATSFSPGVADLVGTRAEQAYPELAPAQIDRLRRFGEVRSWADGELMVKTGGVGDGVFVILKGKVAITRQGELGRRQDILVHGEGSLMGELAQLSGRPALTDGHAKGEVEALVLRPEKLRALMVAEAELGERIMRALILRRVSLIQLGTVGPVIVGRAEDADVIGDVRAGSVKRVAAAVGEGAQVIAAVHGFLADQGAERGV